MAEFFAKFILSGALIFTSTFAHSATFDGEFWNLVPFASRVGPGDFPIPDPSDPDALTEFDVVLNTIAGGSPDAEFKVSALDFPNATATPQIDSLTTGQFATDANGMPVYNETATLGDFLGAFATELSSAEAQENLAGGVFRFTGFVSLMAGVNNFEVTSDDGFQLSLDGNVVPGSFTGPRGLSTSSLTYTSVTDTVASLELIYYDSGAVAAGLFVTQQGSPLSPVADPNTSVVPLPAGGILMLAGLLGFGMLRRRKG